MQRFFKYLLNSTEAKNETNLTSSLLPYTIIQDASLDHLSPEGKITRLLQHVAYGEQEEAEAMLKEDPGLLLQKTNVTDLSRRTFFQVTALQYALWALDWHMWNMLFSYFEDTKNAVKQIQEFETFGVEYLAPGASKPQHEKHCNFSSMFDAMQNYLHNHTSSNYSQAKDDLCLVGKLQRNLPAHVIHEYYHPSRSFNSVPDFEDKEQALPRIQKFYHDTKMYSASRSKNNACALMFAMLNHDHLNIDLAMVRGSLKKPQISDVNIAIYGAKKHIMLDLVALKALFNTRTSELALFIKIQLAPKEEAVASLKLR